MKRVKKILATLVLISFSFCSLGSEIAFAAARSAPPPRPGVRPPAPQPRPPQPRPPQPRPPQPRPPQPRPPRPMPPPPPPPPIYRHRPDYRYDWRYRDWGYRDYGYRRNNISRYEKVGFMLGAIVLLGGILSSINTSEPTHKAPESLPPTPPATKTNSDIEKLRAELKAKPSSVPQTDNLELQKLEEDLRTELAKTPVDKEKAMKIYMALRRKEQELADQKFYDYLDSVK